MVCLFKRLRRLNQFPVKINTGTLGRLWAEHVSDVEEEMRRTRERRKKVTEEADKVQTLREEMERCEWKNISSAWKKVKKNLMEWWSVCKGFSWKVSVFQETPFEIQSTHWGTNKATNPGDTPRTVLIWFVRPAACDVVLLKTREQHGIQWENWKLSFSEDVSREVMGKTFLTIKKLTEDLTVCLKLVYPAKHIITREGDLPGDDMLVMKGSSVTSRRQMSFYQPRTPNN